jgi:hypothetical protein
VDVGTGFLELVSRKVGPSAYALSPRVRFSERNLDPLFTMNFHSALPAGDTVFVQSDFTSVRLCSGKPDSQGN